MPSDQPVPPLDLKKIDFLGDNITVGQLRRKQPELFDRPHKHMDRSFSSLDVSQLTAIEIALAKRAYAMATGQSDPDPEPNKHLAEAEISIGALNFFYKQYG